MHYWGADGTFDEDVLPSAGGRGSCLRLSLDGCAAPPGRARRRLGAGDASGRGSQWRVCSALQKSFSAAVLRARQPQGDTQAFSTLGRRVAQRGLAWGRVGLVCTNGLRPWRRLPHNSSQADRVSGCHVDHGQQARGTTTGRPCAAAKHSSCVACRVTRCSRHTGSHATHPLRPPLAPAPPTGQEYRALTINF